MEVFASASPVFAADGYEATADWDESSDSASVLTYGMTPISAAYIQDGEYTVPVVSSSSYFRIKSALLRVADGTMEAEFHFDSLSYSYIYPGSPAEAASAAMDAYIPCEDTGTDTTFTLSIDALNAPIPCAAFSKKNEKWYGRMLLIDASSLPQDALRIPLPDYKIIEDALESAGYEPQTLLQNAAAAASANTAVDAETPGSQTNDTSRSTSGSASAADSDSTVGSASAPDSLSASGSDSAVVSDSASNTDAAYDPAAASINLDDGKYSIAADMSGGSGRASISSPMLLTVHNGKAYATLLWSSRYYDYMIVNGRTYYNESEEGAPSSFTIPILSMDEPFDVIADTTAMDKPVEITYTLTFYRDSVGSKGMIPQEAAKRVLAVAAVIIIIGGILNHFVQKKRNP
ncbi:MAG: hypothetical protein Q4B22_06340 [Eubacteriales bacterium]|nr:hypothetical protein [Eubacteriales bacterium]